MSLLSGLKPDLDIAAEFQVRDDVIYLNHAMASPWPKRTAEAVRLFADENAFQGQFDLLNWVPVEQELRMRLRRLINADSVDDIAIVKNTSEGISAVAMGLDWAAGQNVVLPVQEFPANRVPWDTVAAAGVDVRKVDIYASDDPEQALMDACDDDTRVLAVSSVQFATGLRMDVERLGRFCRGYGILFVVDAIQSAGALPLDVHAMKCDFLVFGSQKWLLGPEGVACLWSHPDARAAVTPVEFGWRSRQDLFEYDRPEWELEHSARKFECGTQNTLGMRGVNASLSLFEDLGMSRVTDDLLARASYLTEAASAHEGITLCSSPLPERRSGIVVLKPANGDVDGLHRHLMDNKVFCAKRGGGVRLSPHFYTPMARLEHVMELVDGFVRA
ncbi:MAG: aminotransferase class V-fold PLP-dependent enzyme [Gammaproteobacteria bacterium]